MAYSAQHIYEKKSSAGKWIIIVLIVLILALLGTVFLLMKNNSNSREEILPISEKDEKNVDTIDIPGYEVLSFEAGKTKQSVSLANPKQNTCIFVVSLILEDGMELWKSEEIKPGENSKAIVLAKALDTGTYPNSVLKYQCFRLDEQHTPLNGAETKLTIIVK